MKLKHWKILKLFFSLPLLLSANAVRAEGKNQWWRDAVFYQIWPASFQDSNGDGIGDLKGIQQRLPYLCDLGINALWLTPIFTAPSYHGYDAANFLEIDKRYGTNKDFEELLAAAHQKKIRIILDLVLNHVSNQHVWFLESARFTPEFTNYFIWKSEAELKGSAWKKPWMEASTSNWTDVWHQNPIRLKEHRRRFPEMDDSKRPVYYYGVFGDTQPDLNYDEPQVLKEIHQVVKFWLDRGVDGFRLDGARYIFEEVQADGAIIQNDSPKTLQFWQDLACYVKSIKPDAYMVAEVWTTNSMISNYHLDGPCGLDAAFDFTFGNEIVYSLSKKLIDEDKGNDFASLAKKDTFGQALEADSLSQKTSSSFYAHFLSNHDQIRINNQVESNLEFMKAAASALFTLPGTPFIYYGEEIGMNQPAWPTPQDFYDDLFKRAPMLWNSDAHAGFSTSGSVWVDDKKWVPWRPQHHPWWSDFFENVRASNPSYSVESQLSDSHSLLNHYRKLIRVRAERPELRSTEPESLQFLPDNGAVALYRRISLTGSESIVAINSTSAPALVHLPRPEKYIDLLSGSEYNVSSDSEIEIKAFETLILCLQKTLN